MILGFFYRFPKTNLRKNELPKNLPAANRETKKEQKAKFLPENIQN